MRLGSSQVYAFCVSLTTVFGVYRALGVGSPCEGTGAAVTAGTVALLFFAGLRAACFFLYQSPFCTSSLPCALLFFLSRRGPPTSYTSTRFFFRPPYSHKQWPLHSPTRPLDLPCTPGPLRQLHAPAYRMQLGECGSPCDRWGHRFELRWRRPPSGSCRRAAPFFSTRLVLL